MFQFMFLFQFGYAISLNFSKLNWLKKGSSDRYTLLVVDSKTATHCVGLRLVSTDCMKFVFGNGSP